MSQDNHPDPAVLVDDYSALSDLACPRYYKHKHEDRLRSRERESAPYLVAGRAGHAALHYLYGMDWDLEGALEALRAAWPKGYTPSGKHSYMTLGHMELVIEEYFRDRSESPTALEKSDPEILASRESAEEPLIWDWQGQDGTVLTVGGKPDLPTKLAGSQRYVVDHKFTSGWINDYWAYDFRIRHQFRLYVAGLQHLTQEAYDGAYVNAIYIGEPPKSGWKRVKSVQNRLFGPYDYDDEMLRETWEWVKGQQASRALFRRIGIWPQNTQLCNMYGVCEYMDLCSRAPRVRDALAGMLYERVPVTGVLTSGADGED